MSNVLWPRVCRMVFVGPRRSSPRQRRQDVRQTAWPCSRCPRQEPHLREHRTAATLQRIRYVLNAVPDSKTLALQRAVGAPSEPQMERKMVVHEQMQEFRVRYFDGQAWYAEWQRAELPRAVEITLVVQSAGAPARASRFATLVTAD